MQIPEVFVESIQNATGFDKTSFLQAHQVAQVPVSVRLNPFKTTQQFIDNQPVEWSKYGRYLSQRPSFTLDPLFHAGAYYVQEASSMFLERALQTVLNFKNTVKILDLCAAPGGKSTLINSLLSEDSLLVSNEVIKARSSVLADNLTKWGQPNCVVSNNDPVTFGENLPAFFDCVVIDAPCSGSGLFRKDPEAINEWSIEAVEMCAQRQKRIIADVWDTLAERGYLVYSTCSYSETENEDMLDWIADNFEVQSVAIDIEGLGVVETQSTQHKAFGYRFYPDKITGEGFFLAIFKKLEQIPKFNARPFRFKPNKHFKNEETILKNYIKDLDKYHWTLLGDDSLLLPKELYSDYEILSRNLYLRKAGIRLGQLTAKELIPAHDLAMANVLTDKVQTYELNLEEALLYLRRDELRIDSSLRGWTLMTYQGLGLGWAKILPNRLNNYYPKELRILQEI
jgi:16S rRNA C967 or C1407 C5-methylase (RsmB/RsmF family)/NOL1/NOP2/fmu family ribosome biogenesis protein